MTQQLCLFHVFKIGIKTKSLDLPPVYEPTLDTMSQAREEGDELRGSKIVNDLP